MGNLFTDLPTDLREEVFEQLAASQSVRIERIVSKGHVTPKDKWYDQPQHEWVIVLQGAADLELENEKPIRLNPGDYINIPAHQKHRVTWTEATPETIWLAIHYAGTLQSDSNR